VKHAKPDPDLFLAQTARLKSHHQVSRGVGQRLDLLGRSTTGAVEVVSCGRYGLTNLTQRVHTEFFSRSRRFIAFGLSGNSHTPAWWGQGLLTAVHPSTSVAGRPYREHRFRYHIDLTMVVSSLL